MKTKQEIEKMIEDLEYKRINELKNRYNAKTGHDYAVAHNLVMIYAGQQAVLFEVIS